MKKVILVLLLAATMANAETYKWIDNEGTVHFTDSAGEIPEKYRQGAKQLDLGQIDNSVGKGPKLSDEAKDAVKPAQGEGGQTPRLDDMKTRMMSDEGIMAIISSLKDNPDMQAILSDPATMKAVQSGDTGALMNNPAFLKLLDNPQIRAIGKKMGTPGTAGK